MKKCLIIFAFCLFFSGCFSNVTEKNINEEQTTAVHEENKTISYNAIWIKVMKNESKPPLFLNLEYSCYDMQDENIKCYIEIQRLKDHSIIENRTINLNKDLTLPEDERDKLILYEPGLYNIKIIGISKNGILENSTAVLVFDKISYYINDLPQSLSNDLRESYKNAIKNAFDYWSAKTGISFYETNERNNETIILKWFKEISEEKIGEAEVGGVLIDIGLGDNKCYDRYQFYSPKTIEKIAKHEIGHILGYEHSNDTNDIMYEKITYQVYVNDINETILMPPFYYYSYKKCSSEDGNYKISINASKPITLYILDEKNYEKFKETSARGVFVYKNCSIKNAAYFTTICELNNNDFIILLNNGPDAVSATILLSYIEQ
ncbi:MAG: matrixin family metalloprotease [Candidatus Anstonellales archaeon]